MNSGIAYATGEVVNVKSTEEIKRILRMDLLAFINAGWCVRNENWEAGQIYSLRNGSNRTPTVEELVKQGEWWGWPPSPIRASWGHTCYDAFLDLEKGNAKHVCRESNSRKFTRGTTYTLSIEDLIATDWEVWK